MSVPLLVVLGSLELLEYNSFFVDWHRIFLLIGQYTGRLFPQIAKSILQNRLIFFLDNLVRVLLIFCDSKRFSRIFILSCKKQVRRSNFQVLLE